MRSCFNLFFKKIVFSQFFFNLRFNESEPERCKVAFLSSVEFLEPREGELLPALNQHEMPNCPVCLERLEEQVRFLISI